jgi:sugar lactone lactonase YvrE
MTSSSFFGKFNMPGIFLAVVTVVICAAGAAPGTWRVKTIAGTGEPGFSGDGGMAVNARFDNPFGVVRGPDQSLYVAEYDGHRIRRISSDGIVTTVAGTGEAGYSGDGGPAVRAALNRPHEVRFDSGGDLYFTDMANHVIRCIDMETGHISTVTGTGEPGFSGDGGPATDAALKQPHSIQFDGQGNLFICDIGNHRIRMVDAASGIITTLAGDGTRRPTPDGVSFDGVPLNGPRTIDFDAGGDMWLALREGNQVYRLDMKKRTIHHVAGTGRKGFDGNGGPAREASLAGPKGLAISRDGTSVYLADTESHSIRMIDLRTGLLHLVCGDGTKGSGPDGPAEDCRLARPHGVFVDGDGSLLIGDSESHVIRRLFHSDADTVPLPAWKK